MNNIYDYQEKKYNKYFKSQSIDDYINYIYSNCEKTMPSIKKLEKVTNDNIIIPTIKTYDIIIRNNYNVQQLKTFAKYYKLKISGNKNELMNRIYIFLKLSSIIIKIQKIFRGYIQKKYNLLHGPAFFKRELCTNQSDFLTIEDMKDLPYSQFFSYKDNDGFIYGFDIISLYNLILKSGKTLKNPYNRNIIPCNVIADIRTLIRISKVLKIPIDIEIKDVSNDVSTTKSLELRILGLFQNIDSLGNYSDPSWFISLNRVQLLKFLREMVDIWNYRAQLSNEIKRLICPPSGNPFSNINNNIINNESNVDNLKKIILEVMEKMVNNGVDNDNKSLGAYYVLAGLTLVNTDAANSLPWLFQSVSYF